MGEPYSSTNNRIAKNTIVLYFRMIVLMLISLYTSRVILQTLGEHDYGVYNVVGGFVAMFTIVSNTLSAAISRFLTFELGRGDKVQLNKTFSASVFVQCIMVVLLFLFIETFGIWFLNNKMNISPERMIAANWVLQLSAITFAIGLISLPYNSLIIAHEKMTAFAYVSLLEGALKLFVCFCVLYTSQDKLIIYAILLAFVALLVRFIYGVYCRKHFEEATFHFNFDRTLCFKMLSFSGWNFIGASAGVLRSQGVNILINIFFGAAVNAARGISMQVSSVASSMYSNFVMALNPNITKSFASGERERSFSLVIQGARFVEYLIFIISLPIIIETPTILSLWLVEVPDYSVAFVRLILLYMLCESASNTLITLMLATGNIRDYQLIVGGCQLLNLPISYFILKNGAEPYCTLYVSIAIAIVCLFLRLALLSKMVNFPVKRFLKMMFLKVWLIFLLLILVPMLVVIMMPHGILRLIVTCSLCFSLVPLGIYVLACDDSEKLMVRQYIRQIQNKVYACR